jgi:hypothetical protein
MTSHVQRFIDANGPGWLTKLVDQYSIAVTYDGALVSLKYRQGVSPMHEPIVQECRGIVVNTETNIVMAWPYNKFWNLGEPLAAAIDWSTARVQEKLDGSLMILYHDDTYWQVASSGTPLAGGAFGTNERTFADAFWHTFEALGMRLPQRFGDLLTCFMFELCSPANRIIVKYDKPRIVLHGARYLQTGVELGREALETYASRHNWELVKEFPLSSADDCLAAAAALDPMQGEGFVVVDANFNRVKIKSPRYVALHHLRGNGESSVRRIIELWQAGETDELLAHFPEMRAEVDPVLHSIAAIAHHAADDARCGLAGPDRKTFAEWVKARSWAPVAFRLYTDGDPTYEKAVLAIKGMSVAAVERMIETYEERLP